MMEDDERRLWFRREIMPHRAALHSHARRWQGHGWLSPDDLVHEVFVRLIAYQGWREVSNARAFAIACLRNIVLMEARRSRVVPIHAVSDLELETVADDRPGSDRTAEAHDELRWLAACIEDLPPQCRKVFTMRKIHGLSNQDIADRLGLSISTVEKHLAKGLRRCMDRLAAQPAEFATQPAILSGASDRIISPRPSGASTFDRKTDSAGSGRRLGRPSGGSS